MSAVSTASEPELQKKTWSSPREYVDFLQTAYAEWLLATDAKPGEAHQAERCERQHGGKARCGPQRQIDQHVGRCRPARARVDARALVLPFLPPGRRGGLRGPRRPRVPLLLLATGSSFVNHRQRSRCELRPEPFDGGRGARDLRCARSSGRH